MQAAQHRATPVALCPSRHPLIAFASAANLPCDICYTPSATSLLSCRCCNYDVCFACSQNARYSQEDKARSVGWICDGCERKSPSGPRWHCLVCVDCDLCHDCFASGWPPTSAAASKHTPAHNFQAIATQPLASSNLPPIPKDLEVDKNIDCRGSENNKLQRNRDSHVESILASRLNSNQKSSPLDKMSTIKKSSNASWFYRAQSSIAEKMSKMSISQQYHKQQGQHHHQHSSPDALHHAVWSESDDDEEDLKTEYDIPMYNLIPPRRDNSPVRLDPDETQVPHHTQHPPHLQHQQQHYQQHRAYVSSESEYSEDDHKRDSIRFVMNDPFRDVTTEVKYADEPEVRPLLKEDLDEVVRIEDVCFGNKAWTREMIVEAWQSPGHHIYVCASSSRSGAGTPLGFVIYRFREKKQTLQVVNFGVSPEYRGQGLGTMLMRKVFDHAVGSAVVKQLSLHVAENNHTAERLYTRFGFRRDQYLSDYYEIGEHAWEMICPLRSGTSCELLPL